MLGVWLGFRFKISVIGVGLGLSILTGLGGEMLTCDLVTTVSSGTKTSLCACCRFSTGWIMGCVSIRALYLCMCIYVEMDKKGTTAVLPLAIYTSSRN